MPMQITTAIDVSEEVCRDFLTTCVEGGSAYWLACETVERDEDSNVTKIVGCEDVEDAATKWGDATAETMRQGIERIINGSVAVRADIRGTVLAAVLDDDNCDWDAETADCVLQAGLLGEIVYG